MRNQIASLTLCIVLAIVCNAGSQEVSRVFDCAVSGSPSVDSLFKAIPPDRISMDTNGLNAVPKVLDRKNGYMLISYPDQSGNTVKYTAALYIAREKRTRSFIMITRTMHYIAQLPQTEGFWIFEYNTGKCLVMTNEIFPWENDGSLITLPQKGTDLMRCVQTGDDSGLREECTAYSWDVKKARFIKKKK